MLEEISKEAKSQQLEELLVRLLNKLYVFNIEICDSLRKFFNKFNYRLKKQYEYIQLYKY